MTNTKNKLKKHSPSQKLKKTSKNKNAFKKNKKKFNNLKNKTKISDIKDQFTIIEEIKPKKQRKVGRVLPHWLQHPIPVDKNLKGKQKTPLEACPLLHPKLITLLKQNDIQTLFPVQQTVIPQVLKYYDGTENRFPPRDICVATPTGSGKTLAFVLPIVQLLSQSPLPYLGALVILPVIELAKQVHKVFSIYAPPSKLKVGEAFGASSFSEEQNNLIEKTYLGYQSKVHILIATPGRVINHITRTPGLDFSQLRFLVFDEADKLMVGESGELISRIQHHLSQYKGQSRLFSLPPHFPQATIEPPSIKSINSETNEDITNSDSIVSKNLLKEVSFDTSEEANFFDVPLPPMQRLLFSATLSHDPEQLQNVALHMPLLFTTAVDSNDSIKQGITTTDTTVPIRPSELSEQYIKVDPSNKALVLHYILKKEHKTKPHFKALVFASSIELTTKIVLLLKSLSNNRYSVQDFSSKKKTRKLIFDKFRKGEVNVLVSSDAMARGMDVPEIDCVVSYDVPSSHTYIHRIGRTARAGIPGTAVSLVTEPEFKDLKKILGNAFSEVKEREIRQSKLEKLDESFQESLQVLSTAIKANKIKKTLERKK